MDPLPDPLDLHPDAGDVVGFVLHDVFDLGERIPGLHPVLEARDCGVEEAVEEFLRVGPATVRGVAVAMEEASPGILRHREGYLHAALEQMRRGGRVRAGWATLPDGRVRRLWSAPPRATDTEGDEAEAAPSATPAPPFAPGYALSPAWQDTLDETASEAVRSVRSSLQREAARVDIRGHLEDILGDYLRMGLDSREALDLARLDLGDPWRMRSDLGDVYRGRRVIVFPRTFRQRLAHTLLQEVLPIALAVAFVYVVRWQVVQAYNIPSGSMEPTLHGSETDPDYILVNKLAYRLSDPDRFDVVVFYPPMEKDSDDPTAFVKRCIGKGGESIDFRGGDPWVDGVLARRSDGVEDAMMVVAYDLADDLAVAKPDRHGRRSHRRNDDDDLFPPPADSKEAALRRAWVQVYENSWIERAGMWSLDGDRMRALPGEDGAARLEFREAVTNSFRDGAGEFRRNYTSVGDLEVRFQVTAGENATIGADLTEGSERHTLRIGPDGLVLRAEGLPESSFPAVRLPAGRTSEVRFRNVDDRVSVWINGALVARVELPPRTTVPEDPERGGVALVAEGGEARFADVRILRDILFLRAGTSSQWPIQVPEGHLFMVGDNSASSNDSRMWGPVDVHDVIGRPMAVIYPPSRARAVR